MAQTACLVRMAAIWRRVAPGPNPPIRAAGCFLPFGLRREPLAYPRTVPSRLAPADAKHRVLIRIERRGMDRSGALARVDACLVAAPRHLGAVNTEGAQRDN